MRALIRIGATACLAGMALGVDISGAEILLARKKHEPTIRLISVIPRETQANRRGAEERERCCNIPAECGETV